MLDKDSTFFVKTGRRWNWNIVESGIKHYNLNLLISGTNFMKIQPAWQETKSEGFFKHTCFYMK